jgi:xylose dehydrogenase (NAD/NADP)
MKETLSSFTARDWQQIEDTDNPVRLAIIGLGWWTIDKAIPATEAADLCETTVLVSGSKTKAEDVAVDSGIEYYMDYDEYHTGTYSDEYDAVYIATPNGAHLEYVETAAELEKDVLCEKPLEMNVQRGRKLINTAQEAGIQLMTAYRMQTEPAIRRAREFIEAGHIGAPVQVHSHISIPLLEYGTDEGHWKLDPEQGGGALLGVGVYPLNTTRFLLQEEITCVSGTLPSWHPAFEEVEEHPSFQLRFANGVIAHCTASHNSHSASSLRIIGDEGEIVIEPVFHVWDDREITISYNGITSDIEFEQVNQMVEEFEYFAERLLSGREIYPDGEHGLRDLELIDAVRQSDAQNGGWVELETRP